MNTQKLLFDGYMRTEILLNFKSKLSDIISLCNKFFDLNIDEMINEIKITIEIEDDYCSIKDQLRELSVDLVEYEDYSIATNLLNFLIIQQNRKKCPMQSKNIIMIGTH